MNERIRSPDHSVRLRVSHECAISSESLNSPRLTGAENNLVIHSRAVRIWNCHHLWIWSVQNWRDHVKQLTRPLLLVRARETSNTILEFLNRSSAH